MKNTGSLSYSSSEQIDYYPFGLERSNTGQSSSGVFNSGTNPYLYSVNEIDRLNGLHQYDFHARWLDGAVPGFTTPDPLSERHYNENPYAYCGLDPINRIDPLGLDWFGYEDERGVWYDYFPGLRLSDLKGKPLTVGKKSYYLHGGESVSFIYDETEYFGDENGKLHNVSELQEVTVRPSNSYMLYGFAASGNSGSYYDDSEGDGNSSGGSGAYSLFDRAPKQNFSGFWGVVKYLWTGGNVNGFRYDINGKATGIAPIMGMPPLPSIAKIANLSKMSSGLQALFKEGVKGNSIINIRNTLLNNGFTQTLANNKSGYLFINKVGEQVRLMSRNGSWDVRIMNQYGNYLDDIGRVASLGSSHGIMVNSR